MEIEDILLWYVLPALICIIEGVVCFFNKKVYNLLYSSRLQYFVFLIIAIIPVGNILSVITLLKALIIAFFEKYITPSLLKGLENVSTYAQNKLPEHLKGTKK